MMNGYDGNRPTKFELNCFFNFFNYNLFLCGSHFRMTNAPGLIIYQLGHDSTITTIITMSTILKIFINSGVHRRYTETCNPITDSLIFKQKNTY